MVSVIIKASFNHKVKLASSFQITQAGGDGYSWHVPDIKGILFRLIV